MKTKIYLVIFLVLAVFAGYTLYTSSSENNIEKEKAFKVENFEAVTEILVSNKAGQKMSLKKVDEQWILNDKFPVRKHLFEEMKDALTKMEAGSPVPEIGKDVVVKQMVAEAIKVEVFKGKKKDKVIYIGGPNLRNTASHMFLEVNGKVSDRIYNVSIPGFRGYLTTRFTIDENEWRSKDIFSYAPQDVKEIEIKYFNHSEYDNFILKHENNNFSVVVNDQTFTAEQLNEQNIVNYLKLFDKQQLMAYSFVEPELHPLKDSLLRVNKYASLSITHQNEQVQHINVISMPLHEASIKQYDDNGDPMLYDVDFRYIEFGDNKEWGVTSNARFGLLFISPYLLLKNNIKP